MQEACFWGCMNTLSKKEFEQLQKPYISKAAGTLTSG